MTDRLARRTLFSVVLLVAACLTADPADAQIRFGGQLNAADDTDFGLGPRVALDLQELDSNLQVIGTWDFYFPDTDSGTDLDFWELNGNVVYRLALPETDVVVPYGGGGINIARREFEGPTGAESDDTDLGLNVLAGVEFPLLSFTPFVEVRRAIDGGEQFYLTAGVLVP